MHARLHDAVLCAEEHEGKVVEDVPHAGGDDDDLGGLPHLALGLQDRLDHDTLEGIPEDEEHRDDQEKGCIGVPSGQMNDPVGGEHAHHQQRTVGKVDDLDDPEYERQPQCCETIVSAGHDSRL